MVYISSLIHKSYAGKCNHITVRSINTLRLRQNERHFADAIFKGIFLNENVWIPIKLSLKFVPKGPIYNIPALGQIMAWRCPGNKPLSEPMMVNLKTHICVTRPQWVNCNLVETWIWINTGSGNGLLPEGIKPSPDPMLTYHQQSPVTAAHWHSSEGNFTRDTSPINNYANPVYGVATICHQVHWLCWGHPSLFHTPTSLLIWYRMFCVRDISYRLTGMEFINMFSVYTQSGTHSHFNR